MTYNWETKPTTFDAERMLARGNFIEIWNATEFAMANLCSTMLNVEKSHREPIIRHLSNASMAQLVKDLALLDYAQSPDTMNIIVMVANAFENLRLIRNRIVHDRIGLTIKNGKIEQTFTRDPELFRPNPNVYPVTNTMLHRAADEAEEWRTIIWGLNHAIDGKWLQLWLSDMENCLPEAPTKLQ